jgi:hypothetical protein
MLPLSRWPTDRVALLACLWTAVVLLTALVVTTSTVGHLVEADGTRIWSTFGRPIPTWVYWLAFGPSIALAVWRARYPG